MNSTINLENEQLQLFKDNGFIVLHQVLEPKLRNQLSEAIDSLHLQKSENGAYTDVGRWDLRNCLPQHSLFVELLNDTALMQALRAILGWNIKLLGSQIVKMRAQTQSSKHPISWHRDGGVLSAELPDPLPQLFVKVGYCVSGSNAPDGGELLMVPASQRTLGEPALDSDTGLPLGYKRVLVDAGDIILFDWRVWHAVSPNRSDTIRRMLYLAFGYRWLAPLDYQTMPTQLMSTPILTQLLGGSSDLGYYLPTESDVPLRELILNNRN